MKWPQSYNAQWRILHNQALDADVARPCAIRASLALFAVLVVSSLFPLVRHAGQLGRYLEERAAMYPLKWTYKRARGRLDDIGEWATAGEAYVLTVFLVEKTIRRTLVQLVLWNGAVPADAFATVELLKGIWKVKKAWQHYDPNNRSLEENVGNTNWDVVAAGAKYRNALVHGRKHQAQKVYSRHRKKLLTALDDITSRFSTEYGYSGWKKMRHSAGNPI